MKADVLEIFSSVQGEGKYVGCRQVFVRLAGCDLNCAYCDTRYWGEDIRRISWQRAIELVEKLCKQVPTQAVSFTGGEPLLQHEFVGKVARGLKQFGRKIFLETNGTNPFAFEQIADALDVVSMDIKLPSALNGRECFSEHESFLKRARSKDVYVKIVATGETTDEEFNRAVELIAKIDPKILLIIQPVTPIRKVRAAGARRLLQLQATALKKLADVRVIPQTHRIWGAR